jgi:signal transduction histidine kinase
MLLLLGDQLIRDQGIAVFELVKNAFDADSPDVTVTMSNIDVPSTGRIVVEDSGTGMDFDTVTGVWLEPGTDYRVEQKAAAEPTPKYGRTPIGEKGVGRFAAHKLGHQVSLTTRKANSPEVHVQIDWKKDFEGKKYLHDVLIQVSERSPQHFTGTKTGTLLEVTNLRHAWTRGMVRDLARSINSICSPFQMPGEFKPRLILKDHQEWLEGILDINEVLKFALFCGQCRLKQDKLSYRYSFNPYPGMDKIKSRRLVRTGISLRLGRKKKDVRVINLDDHSVGSVRIDLYIFDRDPAFLKLSGVADRQGLKEFLNESGGVRVYRNGIRVYDYGEQGNDWLGLGVRRVNIPAKRISNNLIIGAVSLDLEKSYDLETGRGLIEKTNREGFVENEDYEAFRDAVAFAIQQIEVERNIDKKHIRNIYHRKELREAVLDDLVELRGLVEKKKLTEELGPYLDRIESDFVTIRDRLLTSASAGLSLSVVIHEIEKAVSALVQAVEMDSGRHRIKSLAKQLAGLVEGFATLLRRSGSSREKASSLIRQALLNMDLRLKFHRIRPILKTTKFDFEVNCSRRLTISTIMNIVDNSIWWLDSKWANQEGKKEIYIGTTNEITTGPAIVIADNGPGFLDPPEYLVEPFISRKPDGMGLGLHIADEVMKAQNGKLLFPQKGDLELPDGIDGAVVALVFGGVRK